MSHRFVVEVGEWSATVCARGAAEAAEQAVARLLRLVSSSFIVDALHVEPDPLGLVDGGRGVVGVIVETVARAPVVEAGEIAAVAPAIIAHVRPVAGRTLAPPRRKAS